MTEEAKELRKLRKTVRLFLDAISSVPFRAVDCDQDEIYKLMQKLAIQSNYDD